MKKKKMLLMKQKITIRIINLLMIKKLYCRKWLKSSILKQKTKKVAAPIEVEILLSNPLLNSDLMNK